MINMNTSIYKSIYKKLDKLGILDVKTTKIMKSKGFMDLHIDRLNKNRYSLTHYYEQNRDLVPDPDMEIRVSHKDKMAEALTYQDSLSYKEVYPEEGGVNIALRKSLNKFLDIWLSNLIKQGFGNKKKNAIKPPRKKSAGTKVKTKSRKK